jgi:hypothetical protein
LFSAGFAFSIVVGGTSLRWRRRAGTNDALPAFCGSGGITDSPRLPPSGAPPSCPVRGGTSFCEAPQSALGGPEREKLSQRFRGKWAGRLATPSLSPRSTASAFCWRGFRFLRKRTGDCEFFSTLGPREDLQRVLAHHLSFRCAAWPVILAPRRKGRAFSGMPMWRRSVGKLVVAQSVKYLCSGPMKHQKIGECQDSPSVDKNVSGLVRASDRYLSPAADDCCTGFLGPTDIQSLGDRANIQALRRHSTSRSGNMLATARHISSPTARLTAVVDRLGARRLDRAQTYSIT